jgi:hypothetical protein
MFFVVKFPTTVVSFFLFHSQKMFYVQRADIVRDSAASNHDRKRLRLPEAASTVSGVWQVIQ